LGKNKGVLDVTDPEMFGI